MSMVELSDEQNLFIEKALEGQNILVDACIGSGKTTAIQHLCDAIPSKKKILYLTYNKLLKLDARSKIKKRNVLVTNYHGYAYYLLRRLGVQSGISDLIQEVLRRKPSIPRYDVLVIDEYQDIEQELAELLELIKNDNPGIQIVAVGDMQQKIYNKTTLNIAEFINGFLGKYTNLEFTKCFRLSADHAAMLGRIWNKTIVGVNPNCKISYMKEADAVAFLAEQDPKDVLCLGARTGSLADTLNTLEEEYPDKYNKFNVYASISDSDSLGSTEPNENSAIFTTYDSSKGLERRIVVLFDFTESYWMVRIRKPLQSYEILRNIFCVAASRGKEQIIFVVPGEALLSEQTLSTPEEENTKFDNMEISDMFDFKFKEDVENCFSLINYKMIKTEDNSVININNKDGLIDISPCIGIFQEASFFNGYDIDDSIMFHIMVDEDKRYLYTDEVKESSLEQKILFMTSLETRQNRYRNQVSVPFISASEKQAVHDRLATVFTPDETVQAGCVIHFSDKKNGDILFSAFGMSDVIKDDIVYELKFVSELTHEHFLQCASYVVALGFKKGILWNVHDNQMYEISVPSKKKFLDAVSVAVTKHRLDKYYAPDKTAIVVRNMGYSLYSE
ncbi:MAG: AAA family ATPase [Lachnospiraceae bacterium]|nr:AAA family ATPase [Lachnospiraceae bacterium]